MLADVWLVASFSCAVRLTSSLVLLLASSFVPAFDDSASLVLPVGALQGFARWDALHFLAIGQHGYTLEQQYAFMPMLPRLLASLDQPEHAILLVSCLANLASVAASVMLYSLVLSLVDDRRQARLAALLFALAPSPATQSSPYNEPFFALFTFLGMLCVQHLGLLANLVAAGSFALATSFRSLGVLHAGFFIWPVLTRKISLVRAAGLLVLTAVPLAPFALEQRRAWLLFCQADLPAPSWCSRSLPLIYSYVQEEYWQSGFMRYWTLQQLPNFALAAPVFALSIAASASFYRKHGARSLPFSRSASQIVLAPFVHLHTAQWLLLLFSSHVQIALRLVATGPVTFLFAAELLLSDWKSSARAGYCWGELWVGYCLIWGVVSLLLWAGFYPPA
ncbi:glycosyltransferase family 76 protein [Mixia osmundae IAM 14324]|uniref:GPI mannosyltransferase 2 n=1 Tax=Mixia osmundae (strain CBS 9802 / IAM 14324 / JCM 22182 / KY 12970) TaxID=764103 RepID=G7E909_MIXOS|nr:glycosyltransferase family 76 protein [Mixia osmundae IAM 14324]KEI40262.1 glycosyltransferase family 76 protein [Mixia osmundae IAM 14324]GAA99627.1 hypothetical protein E5Q_06328 [Mixia osmundae IAM 14324]